MFNTIVITRVTLICVFFLVIQCDSSNGSMVGCEKMYETYITQRDEGDNTSALLTLNKAVECDKENEFYKYEKVQFLIALRQYEKALETLESLEVLNNSYSKYYPLSGVLNLKLNKIDEGNLLLKKVYSNLERIEYTNENFNLFFSKIVLDVYFNNRDYALEQIQTYVGNNENEIEKNEHLLIKKLKGLIQSNKSSKEILFEEILNE